MVEDEHFRARVDALAAFAAATGRMPSRRAADPAEKSLGSWLKTQRQNAGAGRWLDRVATLDERVPTWRTPAGSDRR
ncbi:MULTISPECIES: Helicase associated domain protein [Microbacterium]|uniref:Helicase associated domain protein n=1 Tax=Microbacterium sp. 77mftsu3.1 TaxID=1761802 RepID=UPI0009D94EA9